MTVKKKMFLKLFFIVTAFCFYEAVKFILIFDFNLNSLMLRTKTNLKTDQEQFIRSNAPTARPLISVRPAET